MSIPIATTTISIEREEYVRDVDTPVDADPWGAGYDEDADQVPDAASSWVVVESNIRANLGAPTGRQIAGGTRIEYPLAADPCGLVAGDRLYDERTGRRFAVLWAVDTPGVAGLLASVQAGVYEVTGTGQEEA